MQFGASRFGIGGPSQFLKHAFAAKVMDQRAFGDRKMSANHSQILPHGSMAEELSDEGITGGLGLGKEHDAGGEAIDAMNDEGALAL